MTAFAVARPLPRLARVPPRMRALLGVAGLAVVAIILGLAGGRVAISHYGPGVVAAFAGVPLVIYMWPRPLVALVAMLMAMSLADYGTLPRVPLPGHPPFNSTDLLLLLVVGGTIWRRRWRHWPRDARRVALALMLLLGLALLPTVVMLTRGHDAAREGMLGFKDLAYLAVALTVAVEYRGRLLRPALNIAIVIAVVVSLLSIAAAVSSGVGSVMNHLNSQAVQAGSQATNGATRIRLIGLFFTYAMIFPTIAMAFVVRDRWRLARGLSVIPMLAAVALSLNRNMFFGLAAGMLVSIVLGGPRLRHRALIAVLAFAAVVAIVIQSAVLPAAAGKVISRASSGLSTRVLQSNSITTREDEFTHALRSIAHNPVLGVGWYQFYGAYDFNDYVSPQPRLFVENVYLDFAVDFGLPVLAAFLIFCATVLGTGLSAMRRSADPIARALIASGAGAIIAMLMSCLVGTYLQDLCSVPMFGFICGVVAAAASDARLTPKGAARRPVTGTTRQAPRQPGGVRPLERTPEPRRRPVGRAGNADDSRALVASDPTLVREAESPHRQRRERPARPVHVVLTCDWHLKYALSQAVGLRAAGAEVTMLIRDHVEEFDGSGAERDAALARVHAAGVRTLLIPGRMSDVSRLPQLLALRQRIVAIRPDVAHAHEDADPRALALLAGIPTVLTLHDPTRHPGQTEIDRHKRWFLEGGRARWFERAAVIVIHSEGLRDEVPVRRGREVAVVPHGIEVADVPLPAPAEPAVGFFGRMEPYKGLDVLARAMPRVWAQRPDARVRMAGQGPTRFELADPRIEFERGYLAESALPSFLAGCTFLALPYTQASQSGAGSRAIGHGVPVLASRLGGLPDLALDESWTVEPGDADALAAAILRGLDTGAQASVRRAVLEQVAAPRSWAAAGARTLEVYARLLAQRGRPSVRADR